MGGGDDPGEQHPLLVRLDEVISEALQTQLRRTNASTAVDGEGDAAVGAGVGVVDVELQENDPRDGALDAAACAPLVQAVRAVLEHGLTGNGCAQRRISAPAPRLRQRVFLFFSTCFLFFSVGWSSLVPRN